MSVAVSVAPSPILQFFNNAGQLNVAGSILTQVGGVNYPTYQDPNGNTALPNPIPLNSRGEISNASGVSCQLFLTIGQTYTFTQFDSNGNQLNQAQYVAPVLQSNLATTTNINYNQGSTGAATITLQAKLQQIVSVKDFGAKGDGITDDTVAFQNCIAAFQQNANFRGTTILVPSGHYILSGTLAFTAYAGGTVHNMFVVGDGPDNTVLDWSGSTAGINGITFNPGSHFGVSDLALVNAPGMNLLLNGSGLGTANYCNYFHIRNVRMQGAGSDNFRMFNSYMGEISNCWAFGAGGNNYTYGGFHTSIKTSRCEAATATGVNWSLNGMVYSTFDSCGSDSGSGRGWSITNMNGVTFNSCGAEQNVQDAFTLITGNSTVTGIPSQAQDIHGVVFNGCYTTGNSAGNPGTYGSFITASTQNSRPIDFVITGGEAWPATTSDKALILVGGSGSITCSKNLFNDAGFTAADFISGSVEVKNFTVTGRYCLGTLPGPGNTASISNNLLTTLPLASTANVFYNDLGATIASNQIVVPRGVNKVRVSATVDFTANATGVRQLFIMKNGASVVGLASCSANATSAGDTILTACSPPIVTTAGDAYSCQVYQNSGGSLNVVQNTTTYLAVEAIV